LDWKKVFDGFDKIKVLVIGDVMIDSYIYGKVSRISPEAPVPVVNVDKTEERLGGAGNVALNVKALGAEPILVSAVGKDDKSQRLEALMGEKGLRTDGLVKDPNRVTTIKERVMAGFQHLLRIDAEDTHEVDDDAVAAIIEKVSGLLDEVQVVIFEDYDKGTLRADLIAKIIRMAKSRKVPTVVDPKKRNFLAYSGCSLFKPNLKELKEGINQEVNGGDINSIRAALEALYARMPIGSAMVTLSENGVYITNYKHSNHYPAHRREIADVSGAGDTVISTAALALALGLKNDQIAALSNLAGGLVCEHLGVVPVTKEKLLAEAVKLAL
jgi:rfaE bifunctional protein kinase chain/domain